MRVTVAAFVVVMSVLATGCTTVAPAASIVISVPVQTASAGASGAPSAVPSTASDSIEPAVSVEPSAAPTAQSATPTPKPSKSPKPSVAAMPNLVVAKVALGADPWLINTDTPLKVTVKNDGSADAAKFLVEAEAVSVDGNTTNDLGQMPVDSLAAGASAEVTFNANVATAGDYTITATADFNGDIDESNENDNTKQLKAAAASLPDLTVTDLTDEPITGGPNEYEFNYTLRNLGTADANNFSVLVFYDAPDGSTGQIDKYEVTNPLPAGDNILKFSDGTLPQSGTNHVYIDVDYGNQVDESDEDNNEAGIDVTVK